MDKQKNSKEELFWHLVLAFYLPSVLISTAYGILRLVLPVYAGNLTAVYILIGTIIAAEKIGNMVGDVPTSWFMRRFGVKKTMLIGLWVALIPIVLLFFIQNVLASIVLLFISGFGHALYNITRHAYITIIVRKGLRGRAISAAGGVYRIGSFLGPIIGGLVGSSFGLTYTFLAFGIITSVTLLFVWRFMHTTDGNELNTNQNSQKAIFSEVFGNHGRVLFSAGAGQILAQLIRSGWAVLIPLYAANILKLPVDTIGYIVGLGAGIDMLFFLSSGFIMDKFGRKWAIVPSFIFQGIGVMAILLTANAFQLALVAAFIGLANATSSGTMMTLGSDLAPAHLRGEFLSVWRLIGDAGSVAAPMIIGAIAQAFILQSSVTSIAGAGFGAALMFIFFVPETFKRKQVVSAD